MKKQILIIAAAFMALILTSTVCAQIDTNLTNSVTTDTTNNIPIFGDVSTDSLPTSKEDLWRWAIAVVVPALMMVFKKIVPRIPGWVIVSLTPLVGIGLGLGVKALTSANLGWVDGTQAGALAVFIHQLWKQAVESAKSKPTQHQPPSTHLM